jgi:hypothetical protein
MRRYLSETNLIKAGALALVMTVMSVPRIQHWGVPLSAYIPAALFAMILISGAATAWGADGGMVGLFPETRRIAAGTAVAVVLVALALPLQLLYLNPMLREGLVATGNAAALRLRFPDSTWGKLGLLLWSAGFEIMFLQAALISFLARLLHNRWRALGVAFLLLVLIAHTIISPLNLGGLTTALVLGGAAMYTTGCWLFSAFGLIPTMLYAGGLTVHHFFQ